MDRKLPIRTYERRKIINPTTKLEHAELVNINDDDSLKKLSKKMTKQEELNNSLIDPFDTTFDKLLRNARTSVLTVETHNNYSYSNDTNSSTDSSNVEIVGCNILLQNLQDSKSVCGRKLKCKKSQIHDVKQPKKVEKSSLNNKKLLKKRNRTLKVQSKVKKKEINKSMQFHKTRSQKEKSVFMDSNSRHLNSKSTIYISDSSEHSNNEIAIIHEPSPNKRYILRSEDKKNETLSVTISPTRIKYKPCFVVLNDFDISKWEKNVGNTQDNRYNCDYSETRENSLLKNYSNCYEVSQQDNQDLEYRNAVSVKHCSVKIERLETVLDTKLNIIRKISKDIMSSTPIRKRKSWIHTISLSPITINYHQRLNPHIVNEKSDRNLCNHDILTSEPFQNTGSTCTDNKLNFNSKEILDASSDQASSNSLGISNCFAESIQEDSLSHTETQSTLMQKCIELDRRGKRKIRLLNLSLDTNNSHSLFSDNSIERMQKVSNINGVSDKVIAQSLQSFETRDLTIKHLAVINTDEEKLATLKTSVYDVDSEVKYIDDLNSIVENRTGDVKQLNNTDHNRYGSVSYEEINDNSRKMVPCHVILSRLQDTVRITKRRKQYRKWHLESSDIYTNYNNVSYGTNSRTHSEKEKENQKLKSYNNSRESMTSVMEISNNNTCEELIDSLNHNVEETIFLKPGKSWARSLSILHNIKNECNLDKLSIGKGKKWRCSVRDVLDMQKQGVIQSCVGKDKYGRESRSNNKHTLDNNRTIDSIGFGRLSRRTSIRIIPNNETIKSINDIPFLEVYGIVPENNQSLTLSCIRKTSTCSINKANIDNHIAVNHIVTATAKEVVLQRCLQKDYMPFSEYFSDLYLEYCQKIGEGVYGEVFLYEDEKKKSVIKIIPIEGDKCVNGEPQKKFHEILSEIVISKELHNLRYNETYKSDGFVEVKNTKCVIGKYPDKLLKLWNIYDEEKNSDNDCPSMFDEDQLYIILELGHGGQDLEAFVFHTAEEALALFVQAALTLAVAEKAVEFEHRDLHWGNVLISRTDEMYIHFKLEDKEIEVLSKGVKVSIIDFTLSRMSYQGCSIFNDLALDPSLFSAQGEYQFEIYRLMRNKLENNWQKFEPYTNILWLHYTLDKMITAVRYRKKNIRIHKNALMKLEDLKEEVLKYNSSFDLVTDCDKFTKMICIKSKQEKSTTIPKKQRKITNGTFENTLRI